MIFAGSKLWQEGPFILISREMRGKSTISIRLHFCCNLFGVSGQKNSGGAERTVGLFPFLQCHYELCKHMAIIIHIDIVSV